MTDIDHAINTARQSARLEFVACLATEKKLDTITRFAIVQAEADGIDDSLFVSRMAEQLLPVADNREWLEEAIYEWATEETPPLWSVLDRIATSLGAEDRMGAEIDAVLRGLRADAVLQEGVVEKKTQRLADELRWFIGECRDVAQRKNIRHPSLTDAERNQ